MNMIVFATSGCDTCSSEEQLRYESRSCNDPRGLTEKDCDVDTLYSGLAARPDGSAGATGWPADQTFVARTFVGQNRRSLDSLIADPTVTRNIPSGWFLWDNADDDAVDIPDVGYDECENNPDCSTTKDFQTTFTNSLQRWDEQCFGPLVTGVSNVPSRYLPDAQGLYPTSNAAAAGTKATSNSEPGQEYNAVCERGIEKLVRTCTPGRVDAGQTGPGVMSLCGCSGSSNSYVREGIFPPCANTFEGQVGVFGGASCDKADNNRRRRQATTP